MNFWWLLKALIIECIWNITESFSIRVFAVLVCWRYRSKTQLITNLVDEFTIISKITKFITMEELEEVQFSVPNSGKLCKFLDHSALKVTNEDLDKMETGILITIIWLASEITQISTKIWIIYNESWIFQINLLKVWKQS